MAAGPAHQPKTQTQVSAGCKRVQEDTGVEEGQDTKRLRGQDEGKEHVARVDGQVSPNSKITAHSLKGLNKPSGEGNATHEDRYSSIPLITTHSIGGPENQLTGFDALLVAADVLAAKGTKGNPINIDDDDEEEEDESRTAYKQPPTPTAHTNFQFVDAWLMAVEPTGADGEALCEGGDNVELSIQDCQEHTDRGEALPAEMSEDKDSSVPLANSPRPSVRQASHSMDSVAFQVAERLQNVEQPVATDGGVSRFNNRTPSVIIIDDDDGILGQTSRATP